MVLANLKAVDIVCLDFSEAINTASPKMLTERLIKYGLDEQAEKGIKTELTAEPRRL